MNVDLSDRARLRIGVTFGAVSAGLSVASMATLLILGDWNFLVEISGTVFGLMGEGFGVLTIVMIRSQPKNGAVWAIAWAGVFASLYVAGAAGALLLARGAFPGLTYEVFRDLSPAQLPRPAAFAIHFRFWTVYPAIWLPLTLGLLLFPDGHPPSPRWKWVGWWSVLAIALGAAAAALSGNPWSTVPIRASESTVPGTLGSLMTAGFLLASLSAVVSVVSLVVRYRRSSGMARSQIRWIALGGAFLVAFIFVMPSFETEGPSSISSELIGAVAILMLMASYGIAITKYRLYDIDVVISRTVTYGVLAAFITGVYALLVVGIGSLLGAGDNPNLALSIAAVAVVAIAFEPLRNRVQRGANRLVFGKRATPYEVLSKTTTRLADSGSPEETLAQVARLVVDGTGAAEAVLWLKIGDHMQPHSAAPPEALGELAGFPIVDHQLPDIPGEASVPVRHRDELLGALSITKPRGQSVTSADERVLADVAAGSGLLLRNIGLNAELAERAEQLRVSRRRLVAAHDAERHRLERDLHDGAQQQVVALKVKLGIARTLAEREGAIKVAEIVSALASTTQEAVDAMRAVAHGIYPPLLEAEGLEVAVSAVRRTFPIPIDLDTVDLERYERSVEESLYFCVLETITRVVDGGATRVSVSLTGSADAVEFRVGHDGAVGDLVAVEDRIDAFGGRFIMTGEATERTFVGRLPT
ncbi:MAG: histidine kinase, partial [Acidimicrobiia bacterium]|nr:histidine kinase [Acidimicrobiia bacterium]